MLGEGPEKERLIKKKNKDNIYNVLFLSALTKNEMPSFVSAMDVSIVPLRRLNLFKGAIPSKIFENLAMKKPILLGVEGEAYDLFIRDGDSGLFFEPENAEQLTIAINKLITNPELIKTLGENGRQYVSANFDRNTLANNFSDKLQKIFS